MRLNKKFLIASLISVTFFLTNIPPLSHYGIIWDAPVHYWRGQAHLRYFLTREKDYKGLSIRSYRFNRSLYQDEKYDGQYHFALNEAKYLGHPPLNGVLASLSNYIFYQKLGVIGDIESYHLFILFVSSLLVGLVFFFTAEVYGWFAAFVASLSLVLYPLFFSESHFNIKDSVEASFYGLTIYAFYKGITKNNWGWIIISSFFAGLALGTKFNIFFAGFTVLFWLIIYKWKNIRIFKWPFSFKLTLSFLFYPILPLLILIIAWPNLWIDTLERLIGVFLYYKEIGYGIVYQPEKYLTVFNLNTFAGEWILYTTPLVILLFSFWGVVCSLKYGFAEKNKTSLLVLLWFLVPILRVSVPGASIYGGVRQIMEYIPAMAILSGIGANFLVSWLKRVQPLRVEPYGKLLQILVILMFLPITLKLISIHPNENVYFNPLIGGLSGAKERAIPYWGNSFGNVYRQAAEWINKNAERNTRLVLGASYDDTLPKVWLREDIQYSNKLRSGLEKKGEYVVEMTHDMPAWPNFCYWVYVKNFLEPLYEIKVDGVPILKIWKNDWEHTKKDYLSEDKLSVLERCNNDPEFN